MEIGRAESGGAGEWIRQEVPGFSGLHVLCDSYCSLDLYCSLEQHSARGKALTSNCKARATARGKAHRFIGVSRLLTRSGEIPKGWRARLDTLLGTTDWYDELYKIEHTADLFGNDEERVVKATNETIGRYFNDRLKAIFPGVAEPGVLRNSSNNPLYLLCFAAENENGAPTALKIANYLLKEAR